MRIFWTADMNRAARSAPFIGAALPILLILEDRKYVREGPTFGSVLRPSVVVPLHAAHPHHGVDAGAAAKYVAEGHIEFAIVQPRRRVDRHMVVERTADVVEPDTRVRDGRSVVGSSGLDDKNLYAGCGQFRGKDRTSRACPHHDIVLPLFLIRPV